MCSNLDSMGPLHAKHHVSLKSSLLRLPQEYKLVQKGTHLTCLTTRLILCLHANDFSLEAQDSL